MIQTLGKAPVQAYTMVAIENIIKNKSKCYFISPHFDDAVFSAFSALTKIAPECDVTVINVFSQVSDTPLTLSAKKFLQQCGYDDVRKLGEDRNSEDEFVLNKLGVKRINLVFVDALFRKSSSSPIGKALPELTSVYPTYRFHINQGRVSRKDLEMVKQITTELKSIITDPEAVIFCPIGIGKHVDHLIVRDICATLPNKIIYWTDFPYSLNSVLPEKFITKQNLRAFNMPVINSAKDVAVKGYKSQYDAVFGTEEKPYPSETYYIMR